MILAHYGTCPAISAFEQLPAAAERVPIACTPEKLIHHLHGELTRQPAGRNRGPRARHTARGRHDCRADRRAPWLFTDEAYHIDISHLAAVVRMSLIRH